MGVCIAPMVRYIVLLPTVKLAVFHHVNNRNATFNLTYELSMRTQIWEACKANLNIGGEVTLSVVGVFVPNHIATIEFHIIAITVQSVGARVGGVYVCLTSELLSESKNLVTY